MIRLIALDLDGTLLGPDFRVSEADASAVAEAQRRGVLVSVNTSRWYGIALRTAKRLEMQAPLACHNGAHVRQPAEGADLLHLRVPLDIAREVAAFCDEGGWETYTTVNGVTYMRSRWEAQIDPPRLPHDMRIAAKHAEYVTEDATGFVVFGEEAVEALVGEFGERYRDQLAFPLGISETGRAYVTITAPGVDKGTALRVVCEHLEVPPAEVMAVGDATPDIAMFNVAGLGVAMGNAPESMKEVADVVAPSNADSGVSWAIRRYVLKEG